MKDKKDLSVPAGKGAIAPPETRTDLDPIAIMTMPLGEDPSIAELVAFRDSSPDLKFAARQAKKLLDESMRIRISSMHQDAGSRVAAGLMLVGLSFTALTCIWPSDSLDEIEAKLALAESQKIHGDNQEADSSPMLAQDTARRIRVRRAAFNVGELMAAPRPAVPTSTDRGLATWPLQAFDLTTILPPRGGPPVFADTQAQYWAGLMEKAPDLGRLADRVERLLKTAERLFALAQTPDADHPELRRAAEGARILAYVTAAQVAIWPVERGSPGVAAKRRVATLIDARASRGDPLNMQAAIRHIFEEASWLAKLLGPSRMATGIPTWTEVV